jgi:hypothetical protein
MSRRRLSHETLPSLTRAETTVEASGTAVGATGADDQVCQAVAIDIAGVGNRKAGLGVCRPRQAKAVDAVESGQVDGGGKA